MAPAARHARGRTGRLDPVAAHADRPSLVHRVAVEHTRRLQNRNGGIGRRLLTAAALLVREQRERDHEQ